MVLVAVAGVLLLSRPPKEPVYAGKTVTQWLLDTNADGFWIPNDVYGHIHDELWSKLVDSMKGSNTVGGTPWSASEERLRSEQAVPIRAMGASAIPQLVRLMSARPSAWTRARAAVADRLPARLGRIIYPDALDDLPERRNVAAFDGFTILGTNAESALPALSNLLTPGADNLPLAWAIANIGPKGIAVLTNMLYREPAVRRSDIALALGLQYEEAKSAVPALVDCVERGYASYDVLGALGRIGCEDPRLVPALVRLLSAPGAANNTNLDDMMAYLVLGLQGQKARAAAPLVIAEYRLLVGNANAVAGRRFYRRILRAIAPDMEGQLPPRTADEESENWP